MNSLKEVVLEDDDVCAGDSQSGPVCSTESCTKSAVKYCTLCQSMCQQCHDDHQSFGITKAHKVFPSSEVAALTSKSSKIAKKENIGDTNYSGEVEIKQSEQIRELKLKADNLEDDEVKEETEVKEVCRIDQQEQIHRVAGMVIYKEYVYTVHGKGLTVYCYSRNGSFISKYDHEANIIIWGMCLLMNGNTPMLVVSAHCRIYLVWIAINGTTMDHHQTQQVEYQPYQSFNDRDQLLVCGDNNKINRYSCDGQSLEVISLPGDIRTWAVTCSPGLLW